MTSGPATTGGPSKTDAEISNTELTTMTPGRDIQCLLDIMAALRTPGTGCPWDLEQDFSTVSPYTIEEAYEVADAIQRNDIEDLRDELGDLLLQVVFHARMAEELDEFAFPDVVEAITRKMIRRHPHVFGDEDIRASGMVRGMWERIKAEEKAERKARRAARGLPDPEPRFLDNVATGFPALMEAEKIQRRASRVGFDWGEPEPILAKIREEIGELEEEMQKAPDKANMEGELGDVIFAVANLARHLDIDPEKALKRTNDKFRKRFAAIEDEAKARQTTLEAMTLDEMEAVWQEAKKK